MGLLFFETSLDQEVDDYFKLMYSSSCHESYIHVYYFIIIDCESTRDAMWETVEKACPGFSRDDASTWSLYKSAGKYGLSTRGPSFHRQLVLNRQNPRLIAALRLIMDEEKILVGHDRYTIYRATKTNGGEGDKFSTGPKNVHLDLNPWYQLILLIAKSMCAIIYSNLSLSSRCIISIYVDIGGGVNHSMALSKV